MPQPDRRVQDTRASTTNLGESGSLLLKFTLSPDLVHPAGRRCPDHVTGTYTAITECMDPSRVGGMRAKFQQDLLDISGLLVELADQSRTAIRRATGALLHSDADTARSVVDADDQIDADYRRIEERIYDVIALQAPVASDLRLVLTALHIAADLERMGDLAAHVAKTCLRRYPEPAVP